MICVLVTELSDIPAPVLKDLDTLKVLDWYGVGLQLGIEETELDIIKKNSSDKHTYHVSNALAKTIMLRM